MALPATGTPMTLEAFLAWEAIQPEKHQFWHGEIFAMTGARQSHVIVALNVAAALKAHLRGSPCRAYVSDMQLAVDQAGAAFYPDVFVSCDATDLAAERVLRHPKVIIEILSESTAAFDRGAKFAAYRQIATLQEYVLIDPDSRGIEIFRRTEEDEWLLATRDAERGLILRSLAFEAMPAEVFESLPEASGETGNVD